MGAALDAPQALWPVHVQHVDGAAVAGEPAEAEPAVVDARSRGELEASWLHVLVEQALVWIGRERGGERADAHRGAGTGSATRTDPDVERAGARFRASRGRDPPEVAAQPRTELPVEGGPERAVPVLLEPHAVGQREPDPIIAAIARRSSPAPRAPGRSESSRSGSLRPVMT